MIGHNRILQFYGRRARFNFGLHFSSSMEYLDNLQRDFPLVYMDSRDEDDGIMRSVYAKSTLPFPLRNNSTRW